MKNILITGGAGFLGRGIMNRLGGKGYRFIVYSRDETKQDVCRRSYAAEYVLGDVQDKIRLASTIMKYEVDTIIHAGAIKYIPEAEKNVNECIAVNVDGSRNVAEVAIACEVSMVVGISTDKACEPVNTYGATKMLMERIWQEYAWADTKFVLTRYGNVVGSTGSVIPLFQRQIMEGVVKITDPFMSRFWISINQAVDLILLAMNEESGSLVVPKAQAMTIGNLVSALVRLTPEANPKIEVIGARPGEKRHENIIHQYESVRAKDNVTHYTIGQDVVGESFVLSSGNPEVWLDESMLDRYIREAELV